MKHLAVIMIIAALVSGCAEGILVTVEMNPVARDAAERVAVVVRGYNSGTDTGSAEARCENANEGFPMKIWIMPGDEYGAMVAVRVEAWEGRDRVWTLDHGLEFGEDGLDEQTITVPHSCVSCGPDRFCNMAGGCEDESWTRAFGLTVDDYTPTCLRQ